MGITVGMKGVAETLCEREDTAKEVGSGDLLVYATPCMVALMEGAACEAVAEGLEEGALIHTLEINDEMEDFIMKYLKQSPHQDKIRVHFGDALDIIPACRHR